MLEKEAKRRGVALPALTKPEYYEGILKRYAFSELNDIYGAVGYGGIASAYVISRLLEEQRKTETPALPKVQEVSHEEAQSHLGKPTHGVYVKGESGMLVRFARCCNPVPGDSIVGFISRGRGVIVHTATCPNIQEMEPDRLVSVQWDGHETQPFPVRIHIMARNQKGSLADIAIVLRDEDVNIDGCLLQALVDGRSEMEMVVQVRDVAHLYHVIDRLRHLPSVMEVLRKTANEE